MFHYVGDLDRTFSMLNQLRRQMDRAFDDLDRGGRAAEQAAYPPLNVYDTGTGFVVTAEVPGLQFDALNVTLTRDVLSIAGERKVEAPEGYSVHRRERSAVKFSRSIALPSRVDPEQVGATLNDGVLTVTLSKAAEVQPRKIAVRAE